MKEVVIIASQNPVKIQAVKNAFSQCFSEKEFDYLGIKVDSGVEDQPMTDQDSLAGARMRTENASVLVPNADFWVGIEGGVDFLGEEMTAFAWVVIMSRGNWGKARTATFVLPEEVARLVRGGTELGEADDLLFGEKNSKQKNGAVGLLTGNIIDRTTLYEAAVILALIPFINPDLY